jgi:GTP diphosphokinase / guanosine-3',5'-bis(diphosphate) 3'-diphosphatase
MESLSQILDAALFAAARHAGHRRKGGEPYINHLIEVAQLVSMVAAADANLVMAAFLHDTIEDVGVTPEELIERFSPDVANLVREMTDDKSLPSRQRKQLQIDHAPHLSVRAQIVKLADKISNLRSLLITPPADWDYQRKQQYFEWAKRVVDALSAPDPILKTEFERTHQRFREIQP